MEQLLTLFWVFLKINLLSTSGAASTGLLYNEAVGHFLTEDQFVQAVGLATLLPGSDALQLAMFVGFTVAGIPGGIVSLIAAILPPTILMFAVVSLLHRIQREAWLSRFVEGLTPAVAVLILTVSWKVLMNGTGGEFNWVIVGVGAASLLAYLLEVPAPFVILIAGLIGAFVFK
ncbi:MAG TPA: chromate transporter [Anaerolineales bacterium]|nr:chromate transporter [Anaerolineales bacterium]